MIKESKKPSVVPAHDDLHEDGTIYLLLIYYYIICSTICPYFFYDRNAGLKKSADAFSFPDPLFLLVMWFAKRRLLSKPLPDV